MPVVLIVDPYARIPDEELRDLRVRGFEPRHARDAGSALRSLVESLPSVLLVVLDGDLESAQHTEGLQLIERADARFPELPILAVSCSGRIEHVVAAMQMGAADYLAVGEGFQASRLSDSLARLSEVSRGGVVPNASRFVGNSAAVVMLRRSIRAAAHHDGGLLLVGARGMGKGFAARDIHALSPRRDAPFVVAECARLSLGDLFGSADRGANENGDTGLLRKAARGVLFLDDVEALASEVAKALEPMCGASSGGGSSSSGAQHGSVRVIAALHRFPSRTNPVCSSVARLTELLADDRIDVPGLLERGADISALAEVFLPHGHPGLDAESLELLTSGLLARSIEDLRDLVRLAGQRNPEGLIHPGELQLDNASNASAGQSRRIPFFVSRHAQDHGTLREVGNAYLIWTLQRCAGNRSRAARELGIDRSTLRRKLAELPESRSQVP